MGRIEEIGLIPLRIEAEGFLFQKFGLQGYAERPGWFVDPVGKHRQNKVQSIIFAGSRIRLSMMDDALQLKWPSDFYYKILDRQGKNVTSVYPSLNQLLRSSGNDSGETSSPILLDTALKVSDYLFADFYDSGTDTLIKSYYFKRIRFYPQRIGNKTDGIISKPDTTITIEFANKDKLPDNVLEYRLINRRDTSTWKTTGFTLRLDYLKTDSYYQLETRYTFQPESIDRYHFRVGPLWYQQIWFQWLMFALMIFIIFLSTRGIRKAAGRRQEAIQQKLRIVQSQLNPHFIFNSLSSIQSLMNTGRIKEANMYLSEFSKLMRNTLNSSDKIYDPLDSQINVLDTYLKLEQLRFGFNYEITVQDNLNPSEIEVPVLLFQPLVENAVKHGVSGLKKKGMISIHFLREGRKFICRIGDNGQGYSPDQQNYGYGFRLTKDRIKLINEMTNHKTIVLSVGSSEGTVIQVIFNDWL